jgi:AcrR family transcriptional regulator
MSDTARKFRRRADAALAVFVDKGFSAAKVEDIARHAGVSKGLVYLYFPSKEALLEAIVQRAVAPLAATALSDLETYKGDPRVPITGLLLRLGHLLHDPKTVAIPRLILREALNFPSIAEMYRRNVLDRVAPIVTALIRRGVEDGYFRPVDPELALRSVIGPVVAHMALALIFRITPADGLALERLIKDHLTILFDGLAAPEKKP